MKIELKDVVKAKRDYVTACENVRYWQRKCAELSYIDDYGHFRIRDDADWEYQYARDAARARASKLDDAKVWFKTCLHYITKCQNIDDGLVRMLADLDDRKFRIAIEILANIWEA